MPSTDPDKLERRKGEELRAQLAETPGCLFTERFDTADFREAKALLEERC